MGLTGAPEGRPTGDPARDGVRRGVSRGPDWPLIGRYALLVSLTALIPVPLVDAMTETYLRRRMVRAIADRYGVALDEAATRALGDGDGAGCSGCLLSIVRWPFEKLLKTVFFVLLIKKIADVTSEMLHRGLMLEEAFGRGWLPGDAARVRAAMDRSLASIDTRVLERRFVSVFLDHTNELNRAVHDAARLARRRYGGSGTRLADAADRDALGAAIGQMVALLTEAAHDTAVVPELLHWFRAEMGEPVARIEADAPPGATSSPEARPGEAAPPPEAPPPDDPPAGDPPGEPEVP